MSEKRFSWKIEKLQHLNDEVLLVVDNENKKWKGDILNIVDKLNELNKECKFLAKQRDYWKEKYVEGTETFTLATNCDECDFLGNNGICGYCKFTLNCYDSKEDLIDGGVLPNCPLKPLINKNEQLHCQIIDLQDRLGMNEKVIDDESY